MTSHLVALTCLVVIAMMAMAAAASAATSYTITNLSALPGGSTFRGHALSNTGQVVGDADPLGNGYRHAYSYTPSGGLVDLGTLEGGTYSSAEGVNDSGEIVGEGDTGYGGGKDAFSFTPANGLEGLFIERFSRGPVTVSNSGIVVGTMQGQSFGYHETPFAYVPSLGVMDLGTINNANESIATAISRDSVFNGVDEVVGYSYMAGPNGDGAIHAWSALVGPQGTSGVAELPRVLPSGQSINPADVNGSGEVVGWAWISSRDTHAYLLDPGTGRWVDLGALPGGISSTAEGVNDVGQVVGSSQTAAGSQHAFVYTPSRGMIDLGTLPGDTSSEAIAINDRGVILGLSYPGNGNYPHSVLWMPSEQPTRTSLSCTPGSVVVGTPSTCSVTVSEFAGGPGVPSGTVTFSSDGAGSFSDAATCTLSSGTCHLSYTPSSFGTPTITATYGGDATHESSSASTTLEAIPEHIFGTRTTVSCAPRSVPVGGASTCTATVVETGTDTGTPPGTISLGSDGPGSVSGSGRCTLASGSCQLSYTPLSVGTQTIYAFYNGGPEYESSSASTTLEATVARISVTVSPAPVAAGSSITVKAVALNTSGRRIASFNGSGTWSDVSGKLAPEAPADFVQGVSTTTAHVSGAYANDTITVTSGGGSGTTRAFGVYGPVEHIAIGKLASRSAGTPFAVTATARDALGQTVANYNASATWSDLSGSLTPSAPADFVNGVSTTTGAIVANAFHNDKVTITSGGISGASNVFAVYGPATHVVVSTVSSQPAGGTFTVTATAEDALNQRVVNYTDSAASWSDASGSLTPGSPSPFVAGVSTTAGASVPTPYHADTISVSSTDISGITGTFNVYGPLDHIALNAQGNHAAGATFAVIATAKDVLGQTVADYHGNAAWSDLSGSLSPKDPNTFAGGVSKSTASIVSAFHSDSITLSSGGSQATTNPFDVLGAPDHIVVTAPARVSAPNRFGITATMEDAANNVLTSYTGPATWSDLSGSIAPSVPAKFVNGVSSNPKASITSAVNPNQVTIHSAGASGATGLFAMPVITVTSEHGQPGQGISLTGDGWTPNTTIWMGALDLTANTTVKFCALQADADGSIASTGCTIPISLNPAHTYYLKAYQNTNNHISWLDAVQYTVGPVPSPG